MSDLFKKALSLITGDPALIGKSQPKAAPVKQSTDFLRMPRGKRSQPTITERQLISAESRIGAEIFGPVPQGARREFFNLDPTTWIWHENDGQKETTVRYEIHDTGVLKVLGGARYEFLQGEELNRFVTAVQMYYERVAREVYRRDPQTGQKFA